MNSTTVAETWERKAIRIGFVLHILQVAGAEVLVAETIRRLGARLEPVVFCLDGIGQLGERLLTEGIPVIALGRAPGLDVRTAGRLAREMRTRRVEVLHAHQYTPFFYAALGRLLARRPIHLMFTEHGRHYPDRVSVRRRLVNRFVLAHLADEINAVCGFSARSLSEVDGFPAHRIEIIENGIDPERYQLNADRSALRRRLALDPSKRYVVCVARFHPVKNHYMLLEAFARVAAAAPDVDLLLAGDGPLRSELVERTRTLGLERRVRFLGVRDDIPDLLAACDIFALTSLSEAASLTLLEAMASGLPVVVTDVGGNPEIVRHSIDGFLVPRNDAGAAASAILRLLEDRDLARTMGTSGSARVRERYRLDQTIAKYYERYVRAADALRRGRSATTAES